MRIAIASGKGGAGKTSVTASLVRVWDGPRIAADCDAEAPNLHLFLNPLFRNREVCFLRVPARIAANCSQCGRCRDMCRYGAIAPAPIWTLAPILASAIPGRLAEPVLEESEETLLRDLEAGSSEAAVLLRTPPGPAWRGRAFLRERLGVMLPPVHPLARRKTLRFADLAGETFVVFGAIGFWMPLCRAKIPRATFLEQGTLDATRRIVANSDLPAFHTAVAASRAPAPEGRVVIPLRDLTREYCSNVLFTLFCAHTASRIAGSRTIIVQSIIG